jgi:acetyl-CoA carboxylase carboxyl transferase subunit alpha
LWKSHKFAEQAAAALRFTSADLKKFGVIDEIIDEPLGGAHRDPHQTAARLKLYLLRSLRELGSLSTDELLAARYDKFRRMGEFLEGLEEAPPAS